MALFADLYIFHIVGRIIRRAAIPFYGKGMLADLVRSRAARSRCSRHVAGHAGILGDELVGPAADGKAVLYAIGAVQHVSLAASVRAKMRRDIGRIV